MAAAFPRDRFDDIPDDLVRVGAHRAPAPRGRGWIAFAWAVVATCVLIVAGLYGLSRISPGISFELPIGGGVAEPGGEDPDPEPEVTAITDPALVDPALELSISVLNGSPADGQSQVAAEQIGLAGWPLPSYANASVRDSETTVIYYHSADFEPIAMGLAELLGTDPRQIVLSDAYPGAKVTIVLGADYVAPAGG